MTTDQPRSNAEPPFTPGVEYKIERGVVVRPPGPEGRPIALTPEQIEALGNLGFNNNEIIRSKIVLCAGKHGLRGTSGQESTRSTGQRPLTPARVVIGMMSFN